MKSLVKTSALFASMAATLTGAGAIASARESAPRPNIIFILTDDLGYGDVGVFYQNMRRGSRNPAMPWHSTPQLDRMAAEGARLTHHYCPAPVCAPSRASFLAGLSQGHANVRNNQFDKALADNHTVATVLRHAGYATAAIGKWGLPGEGGGAGQPAHPLNRGFDYYYGSLRHVEGHEHYPKEQLYFSDAKKKRGKIIVWENRTDVTAGLDKCYTTDLFTARAKSWIADHRKSEPGKPFFMYLAFDTPHAVLELPAQAYPSGGGLKGGVQWLGKPGGMINTASGKPDSWMHPDYAHATFVQDGREKAWSNVSKRYATSIRRIDDAVGDLLKLLKDLGIDQNTIVVFTSDNGPSDESYLPGKQMPGFFSSFGPFDGIKRDTWEGGLRAPAIVRWPGKIGAGGVVTAPCAMWDWLPTFAEAAHIAPPAKTDGVSLLGNLQGRESDGQGRGADGQGRGSGRADDYLYFEYFYAGRTPNYKKFEPSRRGRERQQMQAVRQGDYMAVRYNIKNARDDFEIYNIVRDPKQTRDLGVEAVAAGLQAHFKALALRARRPLEDAPRPYDRELMPAIAAPAQVQLKSGLTWRYCEGDFPWVPDCSGLRAVKTGASAEAFDLAGTPLHRGQNAAIAYEGYLRVPADGEYIFNVATDTGLIMRVHEATVIDADYGYKTGETRKAAVRMQAGLHPFSLTYRNDGERIPSLILKWSGPGMSEQTLKSSDFVCLPPFRGQTDS
ncbi:MAG: sulfatase-like hydrolase/transferase [Opitutaceae bacterium]|jgi:arylsulfatase A-like enzyme|nr:sulfatase-like hydrolase/transferase [Opitutaceae bacterium]